MRKIPGRLPAAFLCLCLMAACSQFEDFKEVDEIDYQPSLAVPILFSSMSIQDILEEDDDLSFLDIDENGQLFFTYEDTPATTTSEAVLVGLPDFPLAIPEPSADVPFTFYPGASLRSIDLKGGTLEFQLTSSLQQNVQVRVRIPSLTKDGVAFEQSTTIFYSGSSPSEAAIAPVSVADYTLEVVDDQIRVEYVATSNGQVVEINPIIGQARGWDIYNMQGTFEEETLSIKNDSVAIDLFDNWAGGDLTFEEPKLTVHLENSFGFPAKGHIINLKAITVDNRVIDFQSNSPDNSFVVDYPSIVEMGSSKTTTLVFDKNNSNIADILNARPRLLVYEVDLVLNPNELQDAVGFIQPESRVVTHVEIELPVYGTAKGFEIEQRSEFEMEDTEEIVEGELKLIADNGIPVSLGLQFYFTDQADQIVDSLFSGTTMVLPAAQVDSDGNVVQSNGETTLINIGPERMIRLRSYKDIITRAVVSTADSGNRSVRVNANQTLDIKLGARLVVDPE